MSNTPTMVGLSADEITKLLAGGRARNQYGPKLVEFVNSDEAAINPADVWPEFATKNTSTMYQGFRTAIEKAHLEDIVEVRTVSNGSDGNDKSTSIFLLHKEKVQLALAKHAEATDDNNESE